MQLYIIRHGESFNNELWARTGSENGRLPDPHLTEIGMKQAQHLGQYLVQADQRNSQNGTADWHNRHGYHLTHLYSSLMLRAVQTGHAIADSLNIPLKAWPIIHEWGGIYEHNLETDKYTPLPGATRQFLTERFPRLLLPDWLQEQGWWQQQPYEPREASLARAEKFIDELLTRHGDTEDRIGIVTHGGFTTMLLRVLFKSSQELTFNLKDTEFDIWMNTNNTSITRLDFEENRIVQTYMNRVDHLPTELIT